MEFFKVLHKRKAVRSYLSGKSVPEKDITCILEAINLAPSAKHLQSYQVFLVKSKSAIDKIFHSCFNQRSDFIKNSALILVFCTDPKEAVSYFGKRGKMYSFQDATIAATYSMLAATALGYATCWVGNFREEEVKACIKTKNTPAALIIIGYSNENPQRPKRKPLKLLAKYI